MTTVKKKMLISLLIALIASLSFGTYLAEAAPAGSTVGYVDFLYLVTQHPDAAKANEGMKAEQDALQKEFAAKSVNLGDKEKQELDRQLGQQLEKKRLELIKPISDKVVAAAADVAAVKGLSIVIGKNEVVCGGTDITAEVLQKITGK